jgi:hypothetical protein
MTKQVEVGLVRNFQGRSLSILISVSVKMAKFLVLTNAGPGNSMSRSHDENLNFARVVRGDGECGAFRIKKLCSDQKWIRNRTRIAVTQNMTFRWQLPNLKKNIRLLVYAHCWVSINLIHCLVGFVAVFGFLWGWFFLTLTNPSSDVVMIWPDWLARSIPVIQPKIVINMNKHLFIRNEFNSRNRDLLSTKQPEVALPNLT